ncbi:MAG TPA: hypothetical protein VFJ18_03195 [Pararhizobium sp.]|nr:hypothetical protein [Pararhizobium sp.]
MTVPLVIAALMILLGIGAVVLILGSAATLASALPDDDRRDGEG